MKKELEKFRKRYEKNLQVLKRAHEAARDINRTQEYISLGRQYAAEDKAIYNEMCDAGMYKEWLNLRDELETE